MASSASASVVINFVEHDDGVHASYSGSLNIAGLTSSGQIAMSNSALNANLGLVRFKPGTSGNTATNGYHLVSDHNITTPIWGSASVGLVEATNWNVGRAFGLLIASATNPSRVFVPTGYVSGQTLSGTAFYSGKTLDLLGVTAGSHTYTLAGKTDTITINFKLAEVAPIPLPGGLALMAGALGFAGLLRLRRGGGAAI